MHYCSKCGSEVMDEVKFCAKCGAPQKSYAKADTINTDDFTQIIPKVKPQSTGQNNYNNYDNSKNNFINLIIIGVFIGIVILSAGFVGYYFYQKHDKPTITQKTNVQPSESIENNKDSKGDEQNAVSKENKEANKSTNINSANKESKSSDYIFYNSANDRVTGTQLQSLSRETLALARNEIYARHGYIFQTEPYKSYFNNKTWYKPNASFKGSDEELNEMERYNVKSILEYEERK